MAIQQLALQPLLSMPLMLQFNLPQELMVRIPGKAPHPTSGLGNKREAKGKDQPQNTCKKSVTGRTKLTGGTNNARCVAANPYAPLLSAKCY